ncbi:UDP-N-acetylglucosamine 1-carboxyvinyltransferase [Sphingomonas sp. H160509]|uniref:UDP-N-acetylglucosamine 1-carboxyvinyltransferase n=1 Tax=Sphingomonas sp. H160509 TaxID=2955313 RepID=UPI0020968788|nr:UDP-N-acetylglucosamine 1-carboxyvinyltransferase [Sphingomonas sp. H160509]MDD1453166.1 UDP-N-acetylglucosamine 1-carboxyvinyltransferase [Sphingomonas sp. H160509]
MNTNIASLNLASDDVVNEGSTSASDILHVEHSRLVGEVRVSGAKNSVLRLLAASLLTSERIVLHNYPASLLDAIVHVGMLEALGKTCVVTGDTLTIEEAAVPPSDLEWQGRSIRNTLLILGALVARTGAGSVPMPGGCDLGDRKTDLHEMVLTRLGARVWYEGERLFAEAPNGLTGADIVLPMRSTGATENALIAASLARGTTRLWNPHIRPEILDLARFLERMGAKITVYGQESIEIVGAEQLDGIVHRVMPDNMEAMTWLIGSVITGGDIEIHDFPASDLEVPLIFLRESGAKVFCAGDTAIVRSGRAYPVEISTGPYPGINSDMQPLFAAMGACARGESRIVDLRFINRYAYLEEFAKMGVASDVRGGTAHIQGTSAIRGADVRALDLRAGSALSLLGMVAEGPTRISDAWQIERGYDQFLAKAKALGANMQYGG